jgi:hypothetical protein
MFTLKLTKPAQQQFDQLKTSKHHQGIFRQVQKTLRLLSQNPRHPSLQTHKFESIQHPYVATAPVFEAYAQHHAPSAYRVFWCYGPDRRQITIIAITPHP